MGLFSKEKFKCDICGAEKTKLFTFNVEGGILCNDCFDKLGKEKYQKGFSLEQAKKQLSGFEIVPEPSKEEKKAQKEKLKEEIANFHNLEKNYMKLKLSVNSGKEQINCNGWGNNVIMWQRTDGSIYFDTNFRDNFYLIGYEWSGPEYEIVTNTVTKQKGKKTKKGKSGRMTAGALVGTALMPGVGTVVGAAIGAGGKGKEKTKGTETSDTTQKQVEIPSKAMIYLRDNASGKEIRLIITCDSSVDMELKRFKFIEEPQSIDAYDMQKTAEALKSLKELVDLGVLTQEEFDSKKAELLNN